MSCVVVQKGKYNVPLCHCCNGRNSLPIAVFGTVRDTLNFGLFCFETLTNDSATSRTFIPVNQPPCLYPPWLADLPTP